MTEADLDSMTALLGDPEVMRESSGARELKAQGLTPAAIGKIVGTSRATVYRYLSLANDETV